MKESRQKASLDNISARTDSKPMSTAENHFQEVNNSEKKDTVENAELPEQIKEERQEESDDNKVRGFHSLILNFNLPPITSTVCGQLFKGPS